MKRKEMRELMRAAGAFTIRGKDKKEIAVIFSRNREKAKAVLADRFAGYKVTDEAQALAAVYAKKIHKANPDIDSAEIAIDMDNAVFQRGERFCTAMPFSYQGQRYSYIETADGARVEKTAQI